MYATKNFPSRKLLFLRDGIRFVIYKFLAIIHKTCLCSNLTNLYDVRTLNNRSLRISGFHTGSLTSSDGSKGWRFKDYCIALKYKS